MRLSRLLTVVAAAASVTALVAPSASASDAVPAPYVHPSFESAVAAEPWLAPATTVLVQAVVEPVVESAATPRPGPVVDPLRPIRPLLYSDADADYLASIGAVAVDASAITDSISWSRPQLALKHYLDNNSSISTYCTYARSGAGTADGGGTVDFTVVGEATAYGRYKGVEIVATGVDCTLHKPDMTIGTGLIWAPGSLSAASARRSSYDARGGYVCVEGWALLRTVPAGETSTLKRTGLTCFYV